MTVRSVLLAAGLLLFGAAVYLLVDLAYNLVEGRA